MTEEEMLIEIERRGKKQMNIFFLSDYLAIDFHHGLSLIAESWIVLRWEEVTCMTYYDAHMFDFEVVSVIYRRPQLFSLCISD